MGTPGSRPAPGEGRAKGRSASAGGRRRHVPLRTCVACRRTLAKRELVRIVRTPEGAIAVDLKGKQAGRGAYVCRQPACWDLALRQGVLGRALNVPIAGERLAELRVELERAVGQGEPGDGAPTQGERLQNGTIG